VSVRVEDTGDLPGRPRTLRIRCEHCGAVLVEHGWRVPPDAMAMYQAGLDDGRVIVDHEACCGMRQPKS
jgi:hypothetical protein